MVELSTRLGFVDGTLALLLKFWLMLLLVVAFTLELLLLKLLKCIEISDIENKVEQTLKPFLLDQTLNYEIEAILVSQNMNNHILALYVKI